MPTVLGLLGGGQLGRMTAMAARELGMGVVVLDPDAHCSSAAVVDAVIVASFDDPEAAARLAARASVVSYEIERIGEAAAREVSRIVPLRPSPEILAVVQDRARQKRWLESIGIPIGDWMPVSGVEELVQAQRRFGACRLKASRDGYDGRGQCRMPPGADAHEAWASVGASHAVVEAELELAAECSVLVARRPSGEVSVFPIARNWHVSGILSHNVIPSGLPLGTEVEARRLALAIAEALALEGLLAVECFVLEDGTVLVNELAPRPHNSFHAAEVACETSQFDQLVRAVCDLPLGSTRLLRPTALANLLGEDVLDADADRLSRALEMAGVRVHLYGKAPRPGRKVGHLLATGDHPDEAVERVLAARAKLRTHSAAAQSRASSANAAPSSP